MVIKPPALKSGSTLGIIAPSSPARESACVEKGISVLEDMGFKIALAPNALKKNMYLAGTDMERLDDLHGVFMNVEVDGIVCLRGGYGSMRLLAQIDYKVIRDHPKILIGYSDITALQLAIWKETGLVTFSGPMLDTDFGNEPGDFTITQFLKAVTRTSTLGAIPNQPDFEPLVIYPGRCSGRLTGGNLSLVVSSLGTPYEIDTRGTILFLEEIGEPPYRVERMLQQLRLAGKLDEAAGVVFGECVGCVAKHIETSFTLLEVFMDMFTVLKKPCFYGLGAGHGAHKATLPLGVKAEMDAGKCLLTITGQAVI